MDNSQYDAIVIGSGPGGTSTAALLARWGLTTLLIEKNARVGGKALTASRNGHEYDLWPHGQVPMRGSAFEDVFRELGVESELMPCLSPDDPREVADIKYRARGRSEYKRVALKQTMQDPAPFFDLWGLDEGERLAAVRFLTQMVMMPPDHVDDLDDVTMHDYLSQNDVPYAVYSYLAFHSNASLAEPIDLVSASEQIKIMQQIALKGGGGNYKGGFGRLIDVMARELVSHGGEVVTRAKVEHIIVEGGRAAGVATKAREFRAPIVISSAGIQPTVLKLVGEGAFDSSYVSYIRGLVPGWGFTGARYFLRKPVMTMPIYVGYSDDSWWNVERYERVREGHIPDEIIMFMTVPSNYDPEMSPPGEQCIIAGTICSPDPEAREVKALYRKMDEMMARLWPEAWEVVGHRDYGGPAEISSATRDSVLPGQGGECVGLGQIAGQCGKHKPSPVSPIPGLYFVGADAGSAGMGTHQAADSGIKVARLAREHHETLQRSA